VLPVNGKVYAGTLGSGVAILTLTMCDRTDVAMIIDEPIIEEGKIYLQWHPLAHWGIPSPSEIFTRYRTEGTAWSGWSTEHAVTFRNLKPGDHTFDVQARNLFQTNSNRIHSQRFSILPPLYMQIPFVLPIAAVTIVLMLIIAGSIRRERKFTMELRNREHKLSALALKISQTQEDERRTVATYLHDEISQALGYCKMKLAIMYERSPGEEVAALHTIVSQLYEKSRFKTFELSPHVLYELGLTEAIRVYAEQMEEQHRIAVIVEEDGRA